MSTSPLADRAASQASPPEMVISPLAVLTSRLSMMFAASTSPLAVWIEIVPVRSRASTSPDAVMMLAPARKLRASTSPEAVRSLICEPSARLAGRRTMMWKSSSGLRRRRERFQSSGRKPYWS